MHDPRLVLLDEPFTGLDGASAERPARAPRAPRRRRMSRAARHARIRPGRRRARSRGDHARRPASPPSPGRATGGRRIATPSGEALTMFSGRPGRSSARTSQSKSAAARRWRRRSSLRCPWSSSLRSRWSGKAGVVADAAVGILWVAIAFSGTLALGRTFERERYTDTLRALLLAPAIGRDLRRQAAGHARRHLRRRVHAGAAGGAAVRCGAAGAAAPAVGAAGHRARSGLPRSGRCLPRCWCVRTAATSCCRCCCIR